jgi:hypothetical protein
MFDAKNVAFSAPCGQCDKNVRNVATAVATQRGTLRSNRLARYLLFTMVSSHLL